ADRPCPLSSCCSIRSTLPPALSLLGQDAAPLPPPFYAKIGPGIRVGRQTGDSSRIQPGLSRSRPKTWVIDGGTDRAPRSMETRSSRPRMGFESIRPPDPAPDPTLGRPSRRFEGGAVLEARHCVAWIRAIRPWRGGRA